ncbi:MAG: hypothetical protein KIS68_11155 [Bauldia sp.]|nr:hypothetical protein [Bauldia sp.]
MEPSSNRPGRMNTPLVFGIVILAVGAWMLIARFFGWRLGPDWWPLIFLVPGLAFLGLAFSGPRANPGLAVAGAIVSTLGGIFLFQTATNNWESWTYIWALFPFAAGVALIAAGNRNGDEAMARSGTDTARWAGITFLVLLVFFELLIFRGLLGVLLPIVLIAIGGYIVWQQMQRNVDREASGPFGMGPGATPPPTPPPAAPVPPAPPAPSRTRPWENEAGPSVIVTPPPAPAPPDATAPPRESVAPPPPMPSPTEPAPPRPPAPELASEPFPADELPPDPSVPVPTAPFPVDEGSEQIAAAAKKRTRTPRPRPPKAP